MSAIPNSTPSTPAAGILALLWLLGTFALVVGVVLTVWAFRIRSAVRGALSG